MKNVEYFLSVL